MSNYRTIRILAAGVALFAAPAMALAEDAISAPAQKTIGAPKSAMVPSLAVLNSKGANLEGNVLTLTGAAPISIVFADRPVRSAGHVLTSEFIKQWGDGPDSFSKDPPNATISVFSADGASVKDAVVVLKAPKLEGDKLTFEVSVLEGNLANADGPASLFIDWFAARGGFDRGGFAGRGYHGGFVAGGYHAPVWRGAWYGHPGAAVGVGLAAGALGAAAAGAAAAPYYYGPPACGYYPYPPCY